MGFTVRLFLPLVLVIVMELADLTTTYISVCIYHNTELNPKVEKALGPNCDIMRAFIKVKLPNIVAGSIVYIFPLLLLPRIRFISRHIQSPSTYQTLCKIVQFGYYLWASILAVTAVNNIVVVIFGVGIGNIFGEYWLIVTALIGITIMCIALLILGKDRIFFCQFNMRPTSSASWLAQRVVATRWWSAQPASTSAPSAAQ